MEFLFEILFSFFGELLLQLVFELLVDFGFGSLADNAKAAKRNPIVAVCGWIVLGAVAGGLSLLLVRVHLLKQIWLRIAMLLIVPALAGLMMTILGKFREAKGQVRTCLESFWCGFAFALAMGLVRFFFAK